MPPTPRGARHIEAAHQTLEQAIVDLEAIKETFGVAAGLSYRGLVFEQARDWEAARQVAGAEALTALVEEWDRRLHKSTAVRLFSDSGE